jgi:hypothetical protein
MIKSIQQKDQKSWRYVYEEKKLIFQRIVGGLVWPAERSGFICVVAEEAAIRPPFQLHLLAEAEEQAADQLIHRARELKSRWKVQDFYAKLDETMLRYLERLNIEARARYERPFEVLAAPYTDSSEIGYHVAILRDRLKPSQKSLHLGSESKLPTALLELTVDRVFDAQDSQYPAIASLAYAVTALTLWEPIDEQRAERTESNYNIFGG